jgi:hypothetical protein
MRGEVMRPPPSTAGNLGGPNGEEVRRDRDDRFAWEISNFFRQLFSIRSHKSAHDFAIEKLGTTSEQND